MITKNKFPTFAEITRAQHVANQLKRFGITINHEGSVTFSSTDQQRALISSVNENDPFKMSVPRYSDQVALEIACYQENINGHIDDFDLAFICQILEIAISREMIRKMIKYI